PRGAWFGFPASRGAKPKGGLGPVRKFPGWPGREDSGRMSALFNWLDQRTGCRKIVHAALYENVPGGARWRYVWGSTLTFTLAVQFITGVVLWMAYAPSSHTAWESVYYIQDVMK